MYTWNAVELSYDCGIRVCLVFGSRYLYNHS